MTVVAAIILAAGRSTRMGQPKQLLDWGGVPLVRVVVGHALASGVHTVYVVTGEASQAVERALAGLPVTCVENADYATGQASSLRVGVAALPAEAHAACVLLGDQPFVTPEIIDSLIAAWHETHAAIVAPQYGRQRGNPVLFSSSVFPELLAVEGDQGARALLQADPTRIQLVSFADTRPLQDIDSPEDYARARVQATE